MINGFVKTPPSSLPCGPRHCDVLYVRLIPRVLGASNLKLLLCHSPLDFLRGHND